MKKLLLLTLLLFSSLAQAEWIVLSCVDKDSSVIVEFDEAAQKVRYQNDNKRIYPAKITEYTIKWSEMGSIQGGGGFMVNFYLDRLTGNLLSLINSQPLGSKFCSAQKKKF